MRKDKRRVLQFTHDLHQNGNTPSAPIQKSNDATPSAPSPSPSHPIETSSSSSVSNSVDAAVETPQKLNFYDVGFTQDEAATQLTPSSSGKRKGSKKKTPKPSKKVSFDLPSSSSKTSVNESGNNLHSCSTTEPEVTASHSNDLVGKSPFEGNGSSSHPENANPIPKKIESVSECAVSFSTGLGRKLPAMTNDQMRKAAARIGEESFMSGSSTEDVPSDQPKTRDDSDGGMGENVPMISFSTAGGKKLPAPSNEQLSKAYRMMGLDAIPLSSSGAQVDDQEVAAVVGFSSGSGRKLPQPSNDELSKASKRIGIEHDFDKFTESSAPPTTSNEASFGFSTGNGKKLPPLSKEQLRQGQIRLGLAEDADMSVADSEAQESTSSAPFKDSTNVIVSSEAAHSFTAMELAGSLFSTGSGRKLDGLSAEQLKRAMAFVGEEPNDEPSRPAPQTPSAPKPFVLPRSRTPVAATPRPREESSEKIEPPAKRSRFKAPKQLAQFATLPAPAPAKSSSSSSAVPRPFATPFQDKRVQLQRASAFQWERYRDWLPVKVYAPGSNISLERFHQMSVSRPDNDLSSSLASSTLQFEPVSSETAISFTFPPHSACPQLTDLLLKSGWAPFQPIGWSELRNVMLSMVDHPQYATERWVSNHYRWIVWKLSAVEHYYPNLLRGNNLKVERVLAQLLYRYSREFSEGSSSALKKVLQRDQPSGRPMVLCVARILLPGGDAAPARVELTDGWYSVTTQLDFPLTGRLFYGQLQVGHKLLVLGAGLTGDAVDPLETTDAQVLYINSNATRRAPVLAKLGFVAGKSPMGRAAALPICLHAIDPQGGTIPNLDVTILRRYPPHFMELKTPEGNINNNRNPSSPLFMSTSTDWAETSTSNANVAGGSSAQMNRKMRHLRTQAAEDEAEAAYRNLYDRRYSYHSEIIERTLTKEFEEYLNQIRSGKIVATSAEEHVFYQRLLHENGLSLGSGTASSTNGQFGPFQVANKDGPSVMRAAEQLWERAKLDQAERKRTMLQTAILEDPLMAKRDVARINRVRVLDNRCGCPMQATISMWNVDATVVEAMWNEGQRLLISQISPASYHGGSRSSRQNSDGLTIGLTFHATRTCVQELPARPHPAFVPRTLASLNDLYSQQLQRNKVSDDFDFMGYVVHVPDPVDVPNPGPAGGMSKVTSWYLTDCAVCSTDGGNDTGPIDPFLFVLRVHCKETEGVKTFAFPKLQCGETYYFENLKPISRSNSSDTNADPCVLEAAADESAVIIPCTRLRNITRDDMIATKNNIGLLCRDPSPVSVALLHKATKLAEAYEAQRAVVGATPARADYSGFLTPSPRCGVPLTPQPTMPVPAQPQRLSFGGSSSSAAPVVPMSPSQTTVGPTQLFTPQRTGQSAPTPGDTPGGTLGMTGPPAPMTSPLSGSLTKPSRLSFGSQPPTATMGAVSGPGGLFPQSSTPSNTTRTAVHQNQRRMSQGMPTGQASSANNSASSPPLWRLAGTVSFDQSFVHDVRVVVDSDPKDAYALSSTHIPLRLAAMPLSISSSGTATPSAPPPLSISFKSPDRISQSSASSTPDAPPTIHMRAYLLLFLPCDNPAKNTADPPHTPVLFGGNALAKMLVTQKSPLASFFERMASNRAHVPSLEPDRASNNDSQNEEQTHQHHPPPAKDTDSSSSGFSPPQAEEGLLGEEGHSHLSKKVPETSVFKKARAFLATYRAQRMACFPMKSQTERGNDRKAQTEARMVVLRWILGNSCVLSEQQLPDLGTAVSLLTPPMTQLEDSGSFSDFTLDEADAVLKDKFYARNGTFGPEIPLPMIVTSEKKKEMFLSHNSKHCCWVRAQGRPILFWWCEGSWKRFVRSLTEALTTFCTLIVVPYKGPLSESIPTAGNLMEVVSALNFHTDDYTEWIHETYSGH